jgi:hypothetical protein
VAAALDALEAQRQLKLRLLQGQDGLGSAQARYLEAEAAADLRAQGLLAHWGLQMASDAQRHAASVAEADGVALV